MQNTMVRGGDSPRPPKTYLSGKKLISKEGGGEIIKMHNIYPCVYLRLSSTRLCYNIL